MDIETDIECPGCKRKMKVKIKDMVPGQKKRCTSCSTEFKFSGDDERKAQKAIDDFQKKLNNLFK